jgi:hypothetical protein
VKLRMACSKNALCSSPIDSVAFDDFSAGRGTLAAEQGEERVALKCRTLLTTVSKL